MDDGDLHSVVSSSVPQARGGETAIAGDEGFPGSYHALAKAIASTIGGVMSEFDSGANAVARSQDELARSVDRLTEELDRLLENMPSVLILQNVTKISSIRKRVSALNLNLKSIQRRIDKTDMLLSKGMLKGGGR